MVPSHARKILLARHHAITPSRRCDNFLYGFKGAPSARQPTGGDSLRELDAGNALGMPRTSIDAWRT